MIYIRILTCIMKQSTLTMLFSDIHKCNLEVCKLQLVEPFKKKKTTSALQKSDTTENFPSLILIQDRLIVPLSSGTIWGWKKKFSHSCILKSFIFFFFFLNLSSFMSFPIVHRTLTYLHLSMGNCTMSMYQCALREQKKNHEINSTWKNKVKRNCKVGKCLNVGKWLRSSIVTWKINKHYK